MFVDDCDIGTVNTIHQAYALSQMSVINETDEASWQKYQSVVYVEFLEIFARVADMMFAKTEMEDERLAWKLE